MDRWRRQFHRTFAVACGTACLLLIVASEAAADGSIGTTTTLVSDTTSSRFGEGVSFSAAVAASPAVSVFTGSDIAGPMGIAAGPDGALWFVNHVGNSIARMTTDGTTAKFTHASLDGPVGVTVGPDDALWYTSYWGWGNVIGRITTSGAITSFSDPTIGRPYGITSGPDDALWFTNYYWNTIGRITTEGAVTSYSHAGINGPSHITSGPDGALWFTNFAGSTIGRITTAGEVTIYSGPGINGPRMIAAGPDGALWFANYYGNTIGRITTGGSISYFSDPTISQPYGITAAPDGALWFTNYLGSTIGRITTDGVVTSHAADTIGGPHGITAGPDGALWFTNYASSTIGRIGSPGEPTGSVDFIDGAEAVCAGVPLDAAGQATCGPIYDLPAGSHTITASYGGDATFTASLSEPVSLEVVPADTTTTLTSDANPAAYSQTVTFTATVAADPPGSETPTGTVQFMQDGSNLGWPEPLDANGQATSPWVFGVGQSEITAVYSGDGNFYASTSPALTQTVNKADSTVSLESDLNPSDYGVGVTFTATTHVVSPGKGVPQGTVDFLDGAMVLCTGVVVDENLATATCGPVTSLVSGDHSITASYSGNANYNGATSDALTQAVEAPPEPDTAINTGPSGWTNDNTPTFTFTTDTAGSSFECSDDGGPYSACTSPHTMPVLPDGPHTCTVRAVNGGTPDGTPATRSFTVDTTAPYTGYAEVEQQLGGQVAASPVLGPLELYWQANDNLAPTGQLLHEWQWRKKVSGTWRAWQVGGTVDELEATSSQPFAKWYQYRVRSVDLAGNWSAWEETDPVKLVAKQETAFTYSTGWVRHTMSGAWGSYVRTRAKVGAWANLGFTGTGVALVMPTGAGQGTVSVCLDPGKASQQCTTVNLATFSPSGARRLVAVFEGLTSGSHVLRVTIVSGTINLDGAIVRQ